MLAYPLVEGVELGDRLSGVRAPGRRVNRGLNVRYLVGAVAGGVGVLDRLAAEQEG